MEKTIIPVALISDDNFIMPTCVAITSLIKNKAPDTFYDIFILMAECQEESEKRIMMLEGPGRALHLIRVSLEKYAGIKQLAHISRACLLKFDLCDLIPDYDKIIYLDGDVIVRGDLGELYNVDLKGSYAAGVKEMDSMIEDKGNVNAGILLFNAKRIREENLSVTLRETRISLGDRGSMDQQTFNIVTGKDYRYLPLKYNCVLGKLIGKQAIAEYTVEKINGLYKTSYQTVGEVIDAALILHFATGNKPWIFTFNPGAKEWYGYYLQSPYKDVPFELRGIWAYRIEKMKNAWKENGISGVWTRVQDKLKRIVLKEKIESWE